METLRNCPNLSQRIESELGFERATHVSQETSRLIMDRIARSLGVNPGVANLFTVSNSQPPNVQEYIVLVTERLAEFQQVDLRSALDQAEEEAFTDDFTEVPIETGLGSILNQMSKWQKDHSGVVDAVKAIGRKMVAKPEIEDVDSGDEEVEEPVASHRADSDSGADDSGSQVSGDSDEGEREQTQESEPAPINDSEAISLCSDLLDDRIRMSQFAKDTYALINPRREQKVDIATALLIADHLKGFNPDKVRKIVTGLLRSEFAHIKDLNYVHYSIFLRHVLQRYLA